MNRKAVRAVVIRQGKLLVMHRNKFGQEYYTLPGGGIDPGETAEQALIRELKEETSITISQPRLIFIERAGDPFGIQYIYACEYAAGEVGLDPNSEEARIHELGQNLYQPLWLDLSELPNVPFVSTRLKQAIIDALQTGFPAQPLDIT